MTLASVAFMGLGLWADVEGNREAFLKNEYNMTGTEALYSWDHGGFVIWITRLYMVLTLFVAFILAFAAVCCEERVEQATGIISTTAEEGEIEKANTRMTPTTQE